MLSIKEGLEDELLRKKGPKVKGQVTVLYHEPLIKGHKYNDGLRTAEQSGRVVRFFFSRSIKWL